jgi:hypothetical protein
LLGSIVFVLVRHLVIRKRSNSPECYAYFPTESR